MADRITNKQIAIASMIVLAGFQILSTYDLMWHGSNLITLLSGKGRGRLMWMNG
jgi:hypothetical protein